MERRRRRRSPLIKSLGVNHGSAEEQLLLLLLLLASFLLCKRKTPSGPFIGAGMAHLLARRDRHSSLAAVLTDSPPAPKPTFLGKEAATPVIPAYCK